MTAPAPGQAAGIDPWRALRFALDGLERICMGTADEADSSSIAEKALFAAIGHLNVRDIPDSAVAAQEQPAPASASQVRRHEAQAAAAPAPGQAAYEAHAGKMGGRRDAWGELPATYRDAWEAAAQAAPEPLRDGIRELLADIQASADATRPSKKTQTEDEVAAQLRQLLEEA